MPFTLYCTLPASVSLSCLNTSWFNTFIYVFPFFLWTHEPLSCPLSFLPAVKDGFSSWCSLAWVFRIYLASGVESFWKREISKTPSSEKNIFVFKLTTALYASIVAAFKDTGGVLLRGSPGPGKVFFIFIFLPDSVLSTACLVPGRSTAVNKGRASQLSKHSMLNESPECVYFSVRACTIPQWEAALWYLRGYVAVIALNNNKVGALDWGRGMDRMQRCCCELLFLLPLVIDALLKSKPSSGASPASCLFTI